MSKPQLVGVESGAHNADLDKTRARLLKGSSWKKQRVVVVLPSADTIPAKVALAHWGMVFPPNQPVYRMLALGMEVGEAYTSALEQILAHPELSTWEYLLTIEHDNAPPPDGVVKLIKRLEDNPSLSAVSGLYFTKGVEGCAQIWGDPKDMLNFRPQVPQPGQLVECCGIGMGFALWRLSMFKDARLRRPWFVTQANAQGAGTQDLYFWADARKNGFRCAVDCDVPVGHYDLTGQFGIADMMW